MTVFMGGVLVRFALFGELTVIFIKCFVQSPTWLFDVSAIVCLFEASSDTIRD